MGDGEHQRGDISTRASVDGPTTVVDGLKGGQYAKILCSVLDGLGEIVYFFTPDGSLGYWNESLNEVTGYDDAEIESMDVGEMVAQDDLDLAARKFVQALETGAWVTFEATLVCKDGSRIQYEFSGKQLVMDGELLGGVGVGRDITDRKERERRLARQNERLEEFAGLVSHDLRNPLQVARAHLELLREETDSEHAERVGDALERMETLIDDMLALARTGQDLTEEDLDPLDLERQVVQTWSAVDCDGTLEVADDVGTVRADAGLFSQLCENLLSNAADHGGPGVTVRVGRLEDAEGFYVADDGPGIPPADRDSVFDTGYSTASDGTGYGLAIVDHVAEAHDWDVAVAESDLGGARFEITGLDAE